MRINLPARKFLLFFSILAVSVFGGTKARAQFTAPTCTPPNCSPAVIQSIPLSGTAQNASINVTGDAKLGATFQAGANAPVLNSAAQNLFYGNLGASSTAGNLLLLQVGAADRLRVALNGNLTSQGVFSGSIGSAIAPTYAFNGDSNTGMYSSGVDQIGLATNGAPRLIVNTTGAAVPGMMAFGANSLTTVDGENLLYGIMRNGSSGNLLLLQTSSGPSYIDAFRVDANGNTEIAGDLRVSGQGVCLANGANCPATGSLGGTGTINYVPKYVSASLLADSQIRDNGTGLGIGGAPSAYKLEVYGTAHANGFSANTTSGAAISGTLTAASGTANYGIYGNANGSAAGYGVYGYYNGSNIGGYGVYGKSDASNGIGVYGTTSGASGAGGDFNASAAGAIALRAQHTGGGVAFAALGSVIGTANLAISGNTTLGDTGADLTTVNGSLAIANSGTLTLAGRPTPPPGANGMMYLNTTDNHIYCYDANVWNPCGAGGTGITGSGGLGVLPKFTSNTSIGNSIVYDNGSMVSITGSLGVSGTASILNGMTADAGNFVVDAITHNVGVGTTSPLAKLHVAGTAIVSSDMTVDAGTLFVGATAHNVGVGTTSPLAKLHVVGNWNGSHGGLTLEGDRPTIRFNSTQGAGGNEKWIAHVGNSPAGSLGFYEGTNGTTWNSRFTISPNGLASVNPAGNFWNEGLEINPSSADDYNAVFFRQTTGSTAGTWFLGRLASSSTLPNAFGLIKEGLTGMLGTTRSDAPLLVDKDGNAYLGGKVQVGGAAGSGPSRFAVRASFGDEIAGSFSSSTSNSIDALAVDARAVGSSPLNVGVSAYAGGGTIRNIAVYANANGADPWGIWIGQGEAAKPGGGSWSSTSDARTKKDVSNFTDGLDVLRKLRPVNYTYNGLAGTPAGLKGIGVIAQEAQKVVPYMVKSESQALHPGETPTQVLMFDPSALPFINTNAIKELDLRIDGFEAKVAKHEQGQDVRIQELESEVKLLQERLDRLERKTSIR